MGSAWSNPGPARKVLVVGTSGEDVMVYKNPAALNDLILALTSIYGQDQYGNNYDAGLNLYDNPQSAHIAFRNLGSDAPQPSGRGKSVIDLTSLAFTIENDTAVSNTDAASITLKVTGSSPPAGNMQMTMQNGILGNPGAFNFGSGPLGNTYFRQLAYSRSVPNAGAFTYIGAAAQTEIIRYSVYGSGFPSLGIWTCPVLGVYYMNATVTGDTTAVVDLEVSHDGGVTYGELCRSKSPGPAPAVSECSKISIFSPGDLVHLGLMQTNGVGAATLTGEWTIGRMFV